MIHGVFQFARKEDAWNISREALQARVSSSPDGTDGFDGFLGSKEQGIMLRLGNTTQPHHWAELERMEGSAEVDVCSLMPSLLWLSNLCCFSSERKKGKLSWREILWTITLSSENLTCLALLFFQQTKLGGHKSKGASGVYETGYFNMCIRGISESSLQQPGDSRFGYRTTVHKSCWDSSGSFSPKRGNLFLCLICCFYWCQISLCECISFPSHPQIDFPLIAAQICVLYILELSSEITSFQMKRRGEELKRCGFHFFINYSASQVMWLEKCRA